MCDLQERELPAPLQAVDCSVYKAVFTDICSLFPGPNFSIVIIAA
jgi:hypothetical protein